VAVWIACTGLSVKYAPADVFERNATKNVSVRNASTDVFVRIALNDVNATQGLHLEMCL
jgi:hypothetical protein